MRVLVMLGVLSLAAVAAAQEGTVAVPSAYKIQFENEWVKVTRVVYGPMAKLPPHAHTPLPAAYVYLNDGGPVRYKHIGGHGTVATRPATKAGAFRIYRGLDEVHAVENTAAVPSEFLRVEFKNTPGDLATFKGKFERPASADGEQVHFDHTQMRATRVWVKPGESRQVAATEPALLIALANGVGMKVGQERWLASGGTITLTNTGTAPVDLLRFDLKTTPTTR
ncbi:MAG: hypothetical protein AB7P34_15720 [Vicinamibacterales bacterium]